MQVVGEDFEVQFIRKKIKREHKWKRDPRSNYYCLMCIELGIIITLLLSYSYC